MKKIRRKTSFQGFHIYPREISSSTEDSYDLSIHGQLFQKAVSLSEELGINSGRTALLLHRGRELERDGRLLVVSLKYRSTTYPITVGIATHQEKHQMELHMIGTKNRLYIEGSVLTVDTMGDYPTKYLRTLEKVNLVNFRLVDSSEFQFEF